MIDHFTMSFASMLFSITSPRYLKCSEKQTNKQTRVLAEDIQHNHTLVSLITISPPQMRVKSVVPRVIHLNHCVESRRSKRKTEIWRLREGRAKWEGGLLSFRFTCPRIQIPTIYQAGSRRVQRIEGTVLKVTAFRGAFRWMVVKVFLPPR